MAKVRFFGSLLNVTRGTKEVEVSAGDVKGLIDELGKLFGERFSGALLDRGGELKAFVNIFVNNRDIRFSGALSTPLRDGDTVFFMPAVGGG